MHKTHPTVSLLTFRDAIFASEGHVYGWLPGSRQPRVVCEPPELLRVQVLLRGDGCKNETLRAPTGVHDEWFECENVAHLRQAIK